MKKSNAVKYFLYKLSSLRAFLAASAILAFAGIPMLVTMLKNYFELYAAEHVGSGWVVADYKLNDIEMFIASYCAMWIILVFLASFALAVIVPVFSFNFYNNRAFTDTIGSLPLTYNQRFWGDFLSGFAVSVAPFLVCIPYILIVANNLFPTNDEYAYWIEYFHKQFEPLSGHIVQYTLIFAVILVSAYTFSSMIASFCGKRDSTAMYLIFGLLLVPGLAAVYSGFLNAELVGIDELKSMLEAISFIPPAGLLPNFLNFWNGLGLSGFTDYETYTEIPPAGYVIMSLLAAAFGVGAYFLGKYRKAERTDRDFVYEGAYAVMSTIITVCILGVGALFYTTSQNNVMYMVYAAVGGIVFYAALALSHTKSFKKLPKELIKYAVICAACFSFFGLADLTDSFGMADLVPNTWEISSIEINGEHFYSYDRKGLVYDDKDAVEAIVSGHKELLSDKSDLLSGPEIKISYKLKNGFVINRQYTAKEGDSIEKFADIILTLPPSNSNVYGVLDSKEDYEVISFHGNYNPANSGKGVSFEIYSSKSEEFRQILLNDIKNNYSETSHQYGGGYCGEVIAAYMKDGEWYSNLYTLYSSYEDTVAFIQNPDNCWTSLDGSNNTEPEPEPESSTYTVQLWAGGEYAEFDIYADNTLGKELIALCKKEHDGEVSDAVIVVSDRGIKYRVAKADEESAVKLILQLAEYYFVQ